MTRWKSYIVLTMFSQNVSEKAKMTMSFICHNAVAMVMDYNYLTFTRWKCCTCEYNVQIFVHSLEGSVSRFLVHA